MTFSEFKSKFSNLVLFTIRGEFAFDKFKLKPLGLFFAIFLCFGFSAGVRFAQINDWHQHKDKHFVNDRPILVSHDAFHWIRWARYDKQVRFGYDEGVNIKSVPNEFLSSSPALISRVIALTSIVSGLDVYRSALYLTPFLASLFVIPLILLFNRLGHPLAGILGALIGSVAHETMSRSCAGCADTDILNPCFPILIAYFLLAAVQAKSELKKIMHVGLSAVSVFLFDWWYTHPEFNFVYFCLMIFMLIIHRTKFLTMIPALILFIMISGFTPIRAGIDTFKEKLSLYTKKSSIHVLEMEPTAEAEQPLFMPNTQSTIAEARNFGVTKSLTLLLKNPILSVLGLLLFLVCSLPLWRFLIPLLPLFGLGIFGFVSGRRFFIYLSPFVGIGFGFLLGWGLWILPTFSQFAKWKHKIKIGIWSAAFLLFLILLPDTAAFLKPSTPFTAEFYLALMEYRTKLPQDSWIWNFWDYGLILSDTTEHHVYNDGRGPWRGINYFLARSYTSHNQADIPKLIAFTDKYQGEMINMSVVPELIKKFEQQSYPLQDKRYLLFDFHMIPFFSAIHQLGAWDFHKSDIPHPGYRLPKCRYVEPNVMKCDAITINVKEGTIDGDKGLLKRGLMIQKGRVIKQSNYGDQGWTLEFILDDSNQILHSILMTEELYLSNFNQMFLIGNYDKNLFEELDNRFPHARLFRVKPTL